MGPLPTLLVMDQTKTWVCFALFALFTVTATTAQRDHKPLDRGIHKRSLLKGYSVLRGQHPSNRKTSGDLDRISAPALRLPNKDKKAVQALMPRACQPVAPSIDSRQPGKPFLLQSFQRHQPKRLRFLPKRQVDRVTCRGGRPSELIRTREQGTASTPEARAASDPTQDWVGPAITLAGLLVGLRAVVLGQAIGNWLFGGGPTHGLILGGVFALLGAILIQVRTFAPIERKVRDAAPPTHGMPFLERIRRERHINKAYWNEVRSTVPMWKVLLFSLGIGFGTIWIGDLVLILIFWFS